MKKRPTSNKSMAPKPAAPRTTWDDTTRTDLLQAIIDIAAPTAEDWVAIMEILNAKGYSYTHTAAIQHLQKLKRKEKTTGCLRSQFMARLTIGPLPWTKARLCPAVMLEDMMLDEDEPACPRCFCGQDESKDIIVSELLNQGEMERLLRDSFGNYVVQTTLEHATNSLRAFSLCFRVLEALLTVAGSPLSRRP
ncbi:Uu.00g032020.m01.CDS01 [Anthostomella pinea]|uniref:Uu.00g032020.m01.CDS01 n=1 Tax=Anthostomella pinea TaxID=933095 RepID=A0AAI8V8G3_9PEZI|nr:Uu.00g032020.m01.CDS01 [Anthostomella pinea]